MIIGDYMAIDKMLRVEDYSIEDLVPLVRDSITDYVRPGQRIAGMLIFYEKSPYHKLKHDIVFYWRALYIQCTDEYDFAMKSFGDWSVYKRFKNNSSVYVRKFQPEWEDEREMRVRSNALKNVVESVEEGNINNSKWLESHLSKFNNKPTQEEKVAAKDKIDKLIPEIDDVMDTIENNYKNLN